jgi:hypothetical protein
MSDHNKLGLVLEKKKTSKSTSSMLVSLKMFTGYQVRQNMSYLLNEVGHMVKAILHNNRFFGLNSFPFRLSLSPLQEPFLLGSLVLRAVLEKHLK